MCRRRLLKKEKQVDSNTFLLQYSRCIRTSTVNFHAKGIRVQGLASVQKGCPVQLGHQDNRQCSEDSNRKVRDEEHSIHVHKSTREDGRGQLPLVQYAQLLHETAKATRSTTTVKQTGNFTQKWDESCEVHGEGWCQTSLRCVASLTTY